MIISQRFLAGCCVVVSSSLSLAHLPTALAMSKQQEPKTIALLRQHRGTAYLPSAEKNHNRSAHRAFMRHSDIACRSNLRLVTYDTYSNRELLSTYASVGENPSVVAVLGVSTSQEALLIEHLSLRYKLLTVSVAGSHDAIGKKSRYLVSGSSPVKNYVEQIVQHIAQKSLKNILVVYNPFESYSTNYQEALQRLLPSSVHVDTFQLHKTTRPEDFTLSNGAYDAIIITNFTYLGTHFLNAYLTKKRRTHTPIIVTPAWHFNESFIAKHVRNHGHHLYTFTTWHISDAMISRNATLNQLKRQNNAALMPQHVQEYDLMTMLLDTICPIPSPSRKSVYHAFKNIRSHNGLVGAYTYQRGQSHPRKPIYFAEYNFFTRAFELQGGQ
jgi:hypothetical protein